MWPGVKNVAVTPSRSHRSSNRGTPTLGPNSPRDSDLASVAPPAIQTDTPSQSKLKQTVGFVIATLLDRGDPGGRTAWPSRPDGSVR